MKRYNRQSPSRTQYIFGCQQTAFQLFELAVHFYTSPVNVIRTAELFGAELNECIYIGDSEVDVQTAHNAKVQCIGVTWGFRDRDCLSDNGCDFIADTADEVCDIIIK